MISTIKRKISINEELLSKIKWENDLVKHTKIILPHRISYFNIKLFFYLIFFSIVTSISSRLTGKEIIPTPL